jgi:release factor glutamine methyltransferase
MKKLFAGSLVLVCLLIVVFVTTRDVELPQADVDADSPSAPNVAQPPVTAGPRLTRDPPAEVVDWRSIEDLPRAIAQFRTVFWDPRDTESLRRLIRETPLVAGKSVLEIGTGTGLLSLCCLQAGAAKVVATDVNPAALNNAAYNAELLGVSERLETRLVPIDRTEAFAVIGPGERFDLIVSNPPWENQTPGRIDDYALYDPGFALMRSMLDGVGEHLKPGGTVLLAYGCVDAIQTLRRLAPDRGLAVRTRDARALEGLPEVFLPGMLLEVTPRDAAAVE